MYKTITYHKIDDGKSMHGIDVDSYPLHEVEYVYNENWNGNGKVNFNIKNNLYLKSIIWKIIIRTFQC